MNKREAQRVIRHIERLQGVSVDGLRVYRVRGVVSYEVNCTVTTTGVPFVVRSMEDIEERNAISAEEWAV